MTPTERFQKNGKFNRNKGILWRFLSLLKPQKRLLINVFLSSLLISGFGILASFFFRSIIDEIVPNDLTQTIYMIAVGVIALYLFKTVLDFFRTHLMLYLSQRLDIPLILGFYQHVLKLPISFFGTRRIGEIISRFMDASKIRKAISGTALSIMIDTVITLILHDIKFSKIGTLNPTQDMVFSP